jgi:hypothetical protein
MKLCQVVSRIDVEFFNISETVSKRLDTNSTLTQLIA